MPDQGKKSKAKLPSLPGLARSADGHTKSESLTRHQGASRQARGAPRFLFLRHARKDPRAYPAVLKNKSPAIK